jgi:hypothetical protein
MHSRFDAFRATGMGKQLEAMLSAEDRYADYAALARAGVPSIVAVHHELAAKFPELATDTTARQFCGSVVADVMLRRGHDLIQSRGRAGGVLFTYGAVFSSFPNTRTFAQLLESLQTFSGRFCTSVIRFSRNLRTKRPSGTGFSVVEHVCHLRDFNGIYLERVKTVARSSLPIIESVDGTALAETRRYRQQSFESALDDFVLGRKKLCSYVARLRPETRTRCGVRDGKCRMSIEDLLYEVANHDGEHMLELDDLFAELTHS